MRKYRKDSHRENLKSISKTEGFSTPRERVKSIHAVTHSIKEKTMSREVNVDQVADIYRKAFDHVCDPIDWKGPIDCVVPFNLANLYMRAIEFMTGVRPEAVGPVSTPTLIDGYRLTCVGYRRGPCGG